MINVSLLCYCYLNRCVRLGMDSHLPQWAVIIQQEKNTVGFLCFFVSTMGCRASLNSCQAFHSVALPPPPPPMGGVCVREFRLGHWIFSNVKWNELCLEFKVE